jgi:SAM-dependent methyltransferase
MTNDDIDYIAKLLGAGMIQSPCLELGASYGGFTSKALIERAGIEYRATDMTPGRDLDYVADFERPVQDVRDVFQKNQEFGSALVLNVLEHTFDPIQVLDNVFELLRDGGTCIIVTPAIWPLHTYPYDCYRLLPNFYEEYCKRRSVELIPEFFEYVGKGSVRTESTDAGYAFPSPGRNKAHFFFSRVVHKLFNTFGRGMMFPSHVAVGAVMRKSVRVTPTPREGPKRL